MHPDIVILIGRDQIDLTMMARTSATMDLMFDLVIVLVGNLVHPISSREQHSRTCVRIQPNELAFLYVQMRLARFRVLAQSLR